MSSAVSGTGRPRPHRRARTGRAGLKASPAPICPGRFLSSLKVNPPQHGVRAPSPLKVFAYIAVPIRWRKRHTII